MAFVSGAPECARPRRRRRRRATAALGPHAEAGFGPSVPAPWTPPTCIAPPPSPTPGTPRVAHTRAGCADRARPMLLPPYRGHATTHTAACCHGTQEDLPFTLSLAIKAGHRPSRADAQCCQAAIAAVLVPTVNPWLRPLSPQTRAAPTSTRTPYSSHARWLSRPGRRLAGNRPPTASAAPSCGPCPRRK
jgi:hypothetical protein